MPHANIASPAPAAPHLTTERTAHLRALDKTHMWHPFTQMQEWTAGEPRIIEAGEGNWLIDSDGNRLLDGVSSLWTNIHGHRHPRIDAAIREQLDRVAHSTLLGLGGAPSIELAARLADIAPAGLSRVFYSDSGSTAVEIAAKIAFQFHRQAPSHLGADPARTRFLAFTNAYHGDTIGSVSLGGMPLFHGIYSPMLFDAVRAPAPYCYRCHRGLAPHHCGLACLDDVAHCLREHGHTICAAVVEPLVQGAAGMLTQPRGWLHGLQTLCREHGVLLIADEVATGFGKTGTMFACQQEAVTPDILCMAKGISGGYLPLAATLTTERLYEGFLGTHESCRTFFHGHTYTGNALACAAALANLDIFTEEHTLLRLAPRIAQLTARLEALRGLPHVGDIRQCGIMTGIELVACKESRRAYPSHLRIGHRVITEAAKRGVILRPLGDVVVLMPPLSLSAAEMDLLMDVTGAAIATVTEGRLA